MLSDDEKKIITIIASHPEYSREQIGKSINKSERMVARHIASLRKKGLIDKVGGNKTGKWVILRDVNA